MREWGKNFAEQKECFQFKKGGGGFFSFQKPFEGQGGV
jgi:hypothetical protein